MIGKQRRLWPILIDATWRSHDADDCDYHGYSAITRSEQNIWRFSTTGEYVTLSVVSSLVPWVHDIEVRARGRAASTGLMATPGPSRSHDLPADQGWILTHSFKHCQITWLLLITSSQRSRMILFLELKFEVVLSHPLHLMTGRGVGLHNVESCGIELKEPGKREGQSSLTTAS